MTAPAAQASHELRESEIRLWHAQLLADGPEAADRWAPGFPGPRLDAAWFYAALLGGRGGAAFRAAAGQIQQISRDSL